MSDVVLDASALVELLMGTPLGETTAEHLAALRPRLHAPAVCDLEVTAVLRRALLAGTLTPDRAAAALHDLRLLPLQRHDHLPLLDDVLALRHDFSASDAAYLVLARALEAELVTADLRFGRAVAAQHDVRVFTPA